MKNKTIFLVLDDEEQYQKLYDILKMQKLEHLLYSSAYEIYKKAMGAFERKNYASSLALFEIIQDTFASEHFVEEQQIRMWVNYFKSAFILGDKYFGKCKGIARKVFDMFPNKQVFPLNDWADFLTKLFLNDEADKEFYYDYFVNTLSYQYKIFGIKSIWQKMHERLVLAGHVEDSIVILNKAYEHCPSSEVRRWAWVKIFNQLYKKNAYDAILTLFDTYQKTIFLPNTEIGLPSHRYERCAIVWVKTHIKFNNLTICEILCNHLLRNHIYINDGKVIHYTKNDRFAKFAYHTLSEIYTKQNKPTCSNFCKQLAIEMEN